MDANEQVRSHVLLFQVGSVGEGKLLDLMRDDFYVIRMDDVEARQRVNSRGKVSYQTLV